MRPAFKILT